VREGDGSWRLLQRDEVSKRVLVTSIYGRGLMVSNSLNIMSLQSSLCYKHSAVLLIIHLTGHLA
jgi:hypothetical protein